MSDENVNKDRLRLWVEALRSDEYGCLGVACKVAVANGLDIDLDTFYHSDSGQNLPREVSEWFGFDEGVVDPELTLPDPEDDDHVITATEANDDLGWSFHDIADAAENRYGLKESVSAA
jgi:hypothetical protein